MSSESYQRYSVLAVLLLAAVPVATAFPGRARRSVSNIWCPDVVLAKGWEPALRTIIEEGPMATGDMGAPENTPPPWLDRERFARGKAFVKKYPLAVAFAHVHGLYMLFAVPSVLDVLVYTGNSDTPDEAFIRYFDTINGVGSWYFTDFYKQGTWGYDQMKYVRGLHKLVRSTMNDDVDKARNRTTLRGDFSGCPISAGMRRDLDKLVHNHCKNGGRVDVQGNTLDGEESARREKDRKFMSQYDMAVTQWAFVGPVIEFPESYGVGNATEKELDGFVYLWEVIGYSLGIDDRYNFCQGGLGPTLRRSRELLAGVVLPSLRQARPPWEYMARCMADGLGYLIPGVDFKTQLANMLRVTLDAPSPSVEAELSTLQAQSAKGYQGIMNALSNDREKVLWSPVGAAVSSLLQSVRMVPKENVKKIRHRPPHRARGCFPDIPT